MLFILSALMLFFLAFFVHRFRVPVRHRWRRRQAKAMAAQFRGRDRLQPPQLLYARLRAMDPLAFEELLLESFERRGYKVIRNRRYTGDGGIDGQVVIDGAVWLIQAKRYADTIRSEHVAAFEALCRTKGRRGLFIHTGRTGAAEPGCRCLRQHYRDHFRSRAPCLADGWVVSRHHRPDAP